MWLRYASVNMPEVQLPNSCQGYVDDVNLCSTTEADMTEMVGKTEEFMTYTGMKVKHRKCALLHGQRSGNSWYAKGKTDRLTLSIQGDNIPKYTRDQSYKYLGHELNLTGNGLDNQLKGIVSKFDICMNNIDDAPLPAPAKLQAINSMAMSKLIFYFPIMHFTEKILEYVETRIVASVRSSLKLNKSSTRSFMFLSKKEGGLGILNPQTLYHAKRLAFAIKCLNSDDDQVQLTARESLRLHMEKRKVSLFDETSDTLLQFAGYQTDENGLLVKHTKAVWGRSDYIDLNNLCCRLGVELIRKEDTYYVRFPVDEDITIDLCEDRAIYSQIKNKYTAKALEYWKNLRNQGNTKVRAIPFADMSVSNQHLINLNLPDMLVAFVVKARLHVLETNAMLAVYYPNTYDGRCHLCNHPTDSVSHVLNGCMIFRAMYIERHDRTVKLISDNLRKVHRDCIIYDNKLITDKLMATRNVFSNIASNKPDIVIINNESEEVYIVEISNPSDTYIDICYSHKILKYTPLADAFETLGYTCRTIGLIIGSSGLVHKNFVPGLQILKLSKSVSKQLTKYCSVSVMVGSFRVWRRRYRYEDIEHQEFNDQDLER